MVALNILLIDRPSNGSDILSHFHVQKFFKTSRLGKFLVSMMFFTFSRVYSVLIRWDTGGRGEDFTLPAFALNEEAMSSLTIRSLI